MSYDFEDDYDDFDPEDFDDAAEPAFEEEPDPIAADELSAGDRFEVRADLTDPEADPGQEPPTERRVVHVAASPSPTDPGAPGYLVWHDGLTYDHRPESTAPDERDHTVRTLWIPAESVAWGFPCPTDLGFGQAMRLTMHPSGRPGAAQGGEVALNVTGEHTITARHRPHLEHPDPEHPQACPVTELLELDVLLPAACVPALTAWLGISASAAEHTTAPLDFRGWSDMVYNPATAKEFATIAMTGAYPATYRNTDSASETVMLSWRIPSAHSDVTYTADVDRQTPGWVVQAHVEAARAGDGGWGGRGWRGRGWNTRGLRGNLISLEAPF